MPEISRRHVLRCAAIGIMSSTAAAVVAQQLTIGSSQAAGGKVPVDEIYVGETYKGRRITISDTADFAVADFATAANASGILIDGAPLHVMTNADGTYTSVVNHYRSFRSLRAAARAAVDDLGDATLVPLHHQIAPHHHG